MTELLTFTISLQVYLWKRWSVAAPLALTLFKGMPSPKKNIWRNGVPRSPSTTPLASTVICKSQKYHISAMPT